jgi:hypothetical protein
VREVATCVATAELAVIHSNVQENAYTLIASVKGRRGREHPRSQLRSGAVWSKVRKPQNSTSEEKRRKETNLSVVNQDFVRVGPSCGGGIVFSGICYNVYPKAMYFITKENIGTLCKEGGTETCIRAPPSRRLV